MEGISRWIYRVLAWLYMKRHFRINNFFKLSQHLARIERFQRGLCSNLVSHIGTQINHYFRDLPWHCPPGQVRVPERKHWEGGSLAGSGRVPHGCENHWPPGYTVPHSVWYESKTWIRAVCLDGFCKSASPPTGAGRRTLIRACRARCGS